MRHNIINTNSIDTLIESIDDNIENNFTPTLVFIYLSVDYNIEYLIQKLKKYKFIIVGSTTVGEIYADSSVGVNSKDKTISCMLTDIDQSAITIKVKEVGDNDFFDFGRKIGKWLNKKFSNPALLTITAGLHFNNESYIEGLQTKNQHFFGAVAGDDRYFKGTYVFTQKKLVKNGVLALAIDRDKVEILTSRGFGWSGIGTQRVVTKSYQNIVYTIDDKPAIEFYKDYLNITPNDMPDMGADYPMEVVLPNGQIVYRAAIHINENGSLLFAGHVKEGSKVRISAPIGETLIDDIGRSVKETYTNNEMYKADLTLVFPCAAHKALLGSYGIKEIEAVYNASKNAPLIGFYAYGEIASSEECNAFHNETFVTVQLREKQ